jgi:hypothetical protein
MQAKGGGDRGVEEGGIEGWKGRGGRDRFILCEYFTCNTLLSVTEAAVSEEGRGEGR